MNKIEVTSKQFLLNHKDFIKGLIMAMGTGASLILFPMFTDIANGNAIDIQWSLAWKAALAAGGVYLTKNFLQPAQEKRTITNAEADQLKGIDKPASK